LEEALQVFVVVLEAPIVGFVVPAAVVFEAPCAAAMLVGVLAEGGACGVASSSELLLSSLLLRMPDERPYVADVKRSSVVVML